MSGLNLYGTRDEIYDVGSTTNNHPHNVANMLTSDSTTGVEVEYKYWEIKIYKFNTICHLYQILWFHSVLH